MNAYALLADGILIAHFLFFLFCVLGEIAVLAGALLSGHVPPGRSGEWFRNRSFRTAHLAAVVFVGFEGLVGILCPLTVWEYDLRRAAGQVFEREIPLATRIIRTLLFHDFPPWVFTALYVGFAVLVVATFFLVKPDRKRRS